MEHPHASTRLDARDVDALIDMGVLPPAAGALVSAPPITPSRLARGVDLLLLLLSAGTGLSGVVFFFAYNWADMHRFGKLGLIQGLLLAALATAILARTRATLASQIGLFCASVFVGVFFATFGQIYQTGADAWQLFVAWAALITPWVILSRTQRQWVLWITLVQAGCWLLWTQHLHPIHDLRPEWVSAALTTLLLALIAARDLLIERRNVAWLRPMWGRTILVAAATLQSVGMFAFDAIEADVSFTSFLGLVFYPASAAAISWWVWHHDRDVPSIAIVGCGAIAAGLSILLRITTDSFDIGIIFLVGFYLVVAFSLLVAGLRHLNMLERLEEEFPHGS